VNRLLVVDIDDAKLEVARRQGADAVVNPRTGDLPRAVDELTDGAGLDGTIDAVGLPATKEQSVALLAPGGTAVWIGLASDEVRFSGMPFVTGERSVLASYAYTHADFQRALEFIVAGRVQVDDWIRVVPLCEGVSAWWSIVRHEEKRPKVLLHPATGPV